MQRHGSLPRDFTASTKVTATSTAALRTLTVARTGAGSGIVTSTPGGISCRSDCSQPHPSGTAVTLTATAVTGSTFADWRGGGCSGTGACRVTLTANTKVTATFTAPLQTLTVARTGTGSGIVTSTPGGISCRSDCSQPYPSGTAVTLTATAVTGSTFVGWRGGGCSGTGVCRMTLAGNTTSPQSLERPRPRTTHHLPVPPRGVEIRRRASRVPDGTRTVSAPVIEVQRTPK